MKLMDFSSFVFMFLSLLLSVTFRIFPAKQGIIQYIIHLNKHTESTLHPQLMFPFSLLSIFFFITLIPDLSEHQQHKALVHL